MILTHTKDFCEKMALKKVDFEFFYIIIIIIIIIIYF